MGLPSFALCCVARKRNLYDIIVSEANKCKKKYLCIRCSSEFDKRGIRCPFCKEKNMIMLTIAIPKQLLKGLRTSFRRQFLFYAFQTDYNKETCKYYGFDWYTELAAWEEYLKETKLVETWFKNRD
jgi:DNA-directed RNA polymerase subunit RPC12/RpoP